MTEKQYKNMVRRAMLRAGLKPVAAIYDEAGNCTVCGEAGRCPGWHDKDGRSCALSHE